MDTSIDHLPPHHETFYFKFFEIELEEFGGKVFLQKHRNASPDVDDLIAFKNDYEYSKLIDSSGVLKSFDLKTDEEGIRLIKEHFEGQPISQLIKHTSLDLENVVRMAISLTQLIDEIHEKGFVIKNLSSHNILISNDRQTLKLSNVSKASDIEKAKDDLTIQHGWEEAVSYLSPEQTGRIGRSTDYRSDYYALGVVLYEILTGSLPFNHESILELVHGHIAVPPVPPAEVDKSIPQVLSNIVLKLLQKNAEDRYQSAYGLIQDLSAVLANLSDLSLLSGMPLGGHDTSNIFNISEKLYGREKELSVLTNAFSRITKGPIETTYVFGYSGIGKTRLIEELQSNISREKGFFASGKFDQYHKETPYFAFTQAFNSLVLQLLSEENDQVVAWKNSLMSTLDGRGQVLVNMAPELEILLGPQEKVFDLGFKDNQERFIKTVIDFLSVLDSEERPLVFFIDDLQWADITSLELINALMHSDLRNVLLIGAFRDNEVDTTHPLSLQIQQFKTDIPDRLSECKLTALPDNDINLLIADSLRLKPDRTSELAHVITSKTQGNPFFIRQFLLSLVDDELVFFNSDLNKWDWHMGAILDLDVTDNVVDLVVKKIQQLDKDTQSAISLAACIGNIWDYGTLKIITQQNDRQLSKAISDIIRLGFVNPIGAWKEFFSELSEFLDIFEKDEQEYKFKFLHDKIQQAAYSLIDESDRIKTHLKVGELLLEQLDETDIYENLFDILDHLNLGLNENLSKDRRRQLGELNAQAGVKAKNTNAIETAVQYLENAMDLLSFERSSEGYKQALIERCECEYLIGRYEKAEALFDRAIKEANSDFDKADILSRKMIVYENTQEHPKAIDAGIQALAILGLDFPTEDRPEILATEFPEVQALLSELSIEELLDHRMMDDPDQLLTMKTLMNLWGPLYLLARQSQLAWMVLRMVRLSVLHGNSIESAVAYAFYGYLISATAHLYHEGYEYGQLGIKLNSKIDDKTMRSKVLVIAEGCISHWKDPYHEILPKVTRAYEIGIETNDIIYAGYAITFMVRCHLRGERNLNSSYEVYKDLLQFAIKIKHELTHQFLLAWMRFIVKMADITPDESAFGEWVEEEAHVAHMKSLSEDKGVHYYLATHYISESIYHYHLGNYDKGLEYSEVTLPIFHSVTGLYEFAEHPIYWLLNILAAARKDKSILETRKETFDSTLQVLKLRAEASPGNFKSTYELVLAESALTNGDFDLARTRLSQCLSTAKNYKDNDVLGMGHQRLAEILFNEMRIKEAMEHVRQSIKAYKAWGADHKVKQIISQFSDLEDLFSTLDFGSLGSKDQTSASGSNIDLETIVRASSILTKEVRLDNLLDRLMHLLVQNAGAQNAYLFLVRDGVLVLEARSLLKDENQTNYDTLLLEDVQDVAKSIIRIVYNSGELISIDNGRNHPKYGQFLDSTPDVKSLLCLPIASGSRTVAVIYLDNKLSNHAFPEERISLLEVLSGQIAISIDNALLYENLEKKVEERTADLASEKQKSEDLLLNILPQDVVSTLKESGRYVPRLHENVSILFADFAEFTQLSQVIHPEALVSMLDDCYKAFDAICVNHEVEKIKTIGDAYMCVSGLAGNKSDHAHRACMVGLEMLEFMESYNKDRKLKGLPYCDIRVGVHSGPVIAGVVGDRKFAFDIWGDSVNTASRMQSHGTPGKLNVSITTWENIKGEFTGESRGKVPVKHKGEIGMYFVNH